MTLLLRPAMTKDSWYPSEHFLEIGKAPPAFVDFPHLLTYDLAVLPTTRRKFWTKARDRGLKQWADLGVVFSVTESEHGYFDNTLTLDLEEIPPGIGGWAAWDEPPWSPEGSVNCAWAHIDNVEFENCYRAKAPGRLAGIITHEVGHTLGFGHGGNGVMAVPRRSNLVNLEEAAALRAYWWPS